MTENPGKRATTQKRKVENCKIGGYGCSPRKKRRNSPGSRPRSRTACVSVFGSEFCPFPEIHTEKLIDKTVNAREPQVQKGIYAISCTFTWLATHRGESMREGCMKEYSRVAVVGSPSPHFITWIRDIFCKYHLSLLEFSFSFSFSLLIFLSLL